MPNFPVKTDLAAGSVVDYLGDQLPVLCGGHYNKKGNCYMYDKEKQQWVEGVYSYGHNTYGIAMVSLGKWLFLAGGYQSQSGKSIDNTIIVDALGSKRNGPKLERAKNGACAAVIKEEGDHKTIAVLGGWNSDQIYHGYQDMEIFSCTIGENPTCIKKPNGPKMQTTHYMFGCGVIRGQNGGKILLAIKDHFEGRKTETLDLDDDSAQWKICEK